MDNMFTVIKLTKHGGWMVKGICVLSVLRSTFPERADRMNPDDVIHLDDEGSLMAIPHDAKPVEFNKIY